MGKYFRNVTLVLLFSAIIGWGALILVYMIPTDRIRTNIMNSIGQYNEADYYPEWSVGYRYTAIDEYTDMTFILPTVIWPGEGDKENPIYNSVMSPHRDYRAIDNDIFPILQNSEKEYFDFCYARYWHGYLIILKPLIYFLSLNSVRILNAVFQIVISGLVLLLSVKMTSDMKLGCALMAAIVVINPISTAINFQLAAVYNVTMVGVLCILLFNKKLRENGNVYIFFLFLGILTVYFDFLTYPVVSLVIPMLTWESVNKNESVSSFVSVSKVIKYSLFWGIGYIGMWSIKWVLATIFSGFEENIILDGYNQLVYRSGNRADESYSYLETVVNNVSVLVIPAILLSMVIIIAVLCISYLIKLRLHTIIINAHISNYILAIVVAGIVPFVWYFVAREHSYDHAVYSYRNLSGAMMALALVVGEIFFSSVNKNV